MRKIKLELTERECWHLLAHLFSSQSVMYNQAMQSEVFSHPVTDSVESPLIDKLKKGLKS